MVRNREIPKEARVEPVRERPRGNVLCSNLQQQRELLLHPAKLRSRLVQLSSLTGFALLPGWQCRL